MKATKIISLVTFAAMLGWQAGAQTVETKELRVVDGRVYDVATSKEWVSITLPAGTELGSVQSIHFTGKVQPIDLTFTLPRSAYSTRLPAYMLVTIRHFPYDAKYLPRPLQADRAMRAIFQEIR